MSIYDYKCSGCNTIVESTHDVKCEVCDSYMVRQFPLTATLLGGTDIYQEALDRSMRQPKASKKRIDKAREVAETMNQHFGAQNE